jgi:hypothetical protein
MVTLKISPYINVILTSDFDFGLDHPVHGGYGRGNPTKKRHGLSPRANYTDRATAACRRSDYQLLRIGGATWSAWRIRRKKVPAPRRTGRQTVGRNITWNWTFVIALQITDPSSRQRGRTTSTNPQLPKNNQRENFDFDFDTFHTFIS